MVKRHRETSENEVLPNKRQRSKGINRLSLLSDELVLVLLSYLPVSDLLCCERLSRRLSVLARDSQLWKSAYYTRFVRPRVLRIPGLRDKEGAAKSLYYSSKLSKWLEDEHLVRAGRTTNWKRQYKLRHNWSKGSCTVSETPVAERPSTPPLLVQFHMGIIVTCDPAKGISAWSVQDNCRLVGSTHWASVEQLGYRNPLPTSMAIDVTRKDASQIRVSIGFKDGSFGLFQLDRRKEAFLCQHIHTSSPNNAITAIAFAYPYILTINEAQSLSLYTFPTVALGKSDSIKLKSPRLLCSLESHTACPPLSLAVRQCPTSILASIAYAVPTYLSGWSVGLQELRLTSDGSILESRVTSALTEEYHSLLGGKAQPPSTASSIVQSTKTQLSRSSLPCTKPTSLSYAHPYLLAAHADNTLMLYLVKSNGNDLSIGLGSRLWGHTSSVSGAYVGDRGKAVSVCKQGTELRIWELEGGRSANSTRRYMATSGASVRLQPEQKSGQNQVFSQNGNDKPPASKGWVAFDDERIVTLREQHQGHQALVVYDFT
ncbi:MAG: hypothetical protein Q9190_000597 [Brigantiaea leucoxantha]